MKERLFDVLCPKALKVRKQEILGHPRNKHCLIRPYLGLRDPTLRLRRDYFTLYNFDLAVNEMEQLGLDVRGHARIMADALAILH